MELPRPSSGRQNRNAGAVVKSKPPVSRARLYAHEALVRRQRRTTVIRREVIAATRAEENTPEARAVGRDVVVVTSALEGGQDIHRSSTLPQHSLGRRSRRAAGRCRPQCAAR